MSKNVVPLVIVLAVIFTGGMGIFFLSNQKDPTSEININPTPLPTNVIISTPMPQATSGANMNNVITTQDGLKIQEILVGSGQEVKNGDTVTVHYLGTLENGTKFDSSYDRSTPFTTQIGVGQVIKGWDEGIVGMKVGGKRKLIIPPDLGYGQQGAGDSIPPNSTLVFEVELLGVK
jgi:peptidylprolyl isomerase